MQISINMQQFKKTQRILLVKEFRNEQYLQNVQSYS